VRFSTAFHACCVSRSVTICDHHPALLQGYGGEQRQQQQQQPGMECVVLQGVGPLGSLGSYLLARWREDVARSAAAAAQGLV
jgi:hypothetical protein